VEPTGPAGEAQVALARRLRALREQEWPGLSVTQSQLGQVLAEALGDRKAFSVAAISSWESARVPRMPQPAHLSAYARFFASRRSAEGSRPRLLEDEELTDAERARRDELEAELLQLRAAAVRAADSRGQAADSFRAMETRSPLGEFWRFPDEEDVTIVCSELPETLKERMPLADRSSPDFVELYAFADLDALVEMHGHIRAVNPGNQVNFRLARQLREDDYTSHLVLLGGVDWNQATEDILALLEVPVSLVSALDRTEDAYFEVKEGGKTHQHRPTVSRVGESTILREDVAHFYCGLNPLNVERSVTICQAVFGRGTYGVVRALTDARFRDRNEDYIKARFAGCDAFSILTRVPIARGLTVTPDWTRSDVRLHEWPQAAE
jgi:hypothetical protein